MTLIRNKVSGKTSAMRAIVLMALVFCMNSAYARIQDSVRVTLTEGTNMAMALLPDKQHIVLDVQGTLWLIPVVGGKAQALTDAMGDNRQPVWSPDGNRIAFQSFRDGDFHIWTVNKNGSGLRQITSGIYHDREPVWSADGSSIAFSSDRSGNYDIWKVDITSGQLTQLTTDPGNDYYPANSPDGKRMAYVSERRAGAGIYVKEATGEERLVVHSKEKLASPVWHPSGEYVIFNSLVRGLSQLEYVKLGGEDWRTLSEPTEDVFPFKVSWLSEQEYLYTSDGQIKRGMVGKKETTTIPFTAEVTLGCHAYKPRVRNFDRQAVQPVQGIRSPVVSPDGSQIAFTALGDLWVLKKGKPQPRAITYDIYPDLDPVWSPDGKQIAYTSDRNGNMDLWVLDLATGKSKCLLDAPDAIKFPSWSPDGSKLAFYQADPKAYSRHVLNILDIKSGKASTVYGSLFEGSQPSWMPDGKHIAISALNSYSTRFREGLSEILIILVDGTTARFMAPMPGRSLATRGKNGPVVSPDGTQLAYIQENVLWTAAIDPEGTLKGSPRQLTDELAECPSWTADSKRIVFLSTDILKEVVVDKGVISTIPMELTWKVKQPTGQLIIHAGKVFNGKSAEYLRDVDVIIEGNRIKSIEPHRPGRSGRFIDASNQVLMPGLFEMHTHQNAYLGEKYGRLWLAYGITSIREPGTDPYDAIERKESWESGKRYGPRTFFTGGHMEGNRIYYNRNTSNTGGRQLELELNRAVKLQYDMIKTYVGLSDSLQERVTAFAHAQGIPVSSHEIYPAMKYGVDAVEHIGATSRRGYSPKLTALNRSYQDVLELLSKSGMYTTPTISLHGGMYSLIKNSPAFFDHWQYNAFYSEGDKQELLATADRMGGSAATYPNIEQSLVTLMRSGARLTLGTDSPIIPPGLSYHAELQSWVKSGLSPFETLRAATQWSAEEIGVGQDLGTVEVGKVADLILVEGDPLTNIKDVLNVKTVIKNGETINREALMK